MRHHSLLSPAITLASLLLGLAACGGGGDNTESVGCPAIVLSDGPALILASVQSAATSASIPVVILSDMTANGLSFSAELYSPTQSLNVRTVGKTLECTLPCGFSSATGEQSFTVSAPGYVPLKVTAQGSYASSRGICPPTLTDGHRITVKLEPI
ncbi:hypothetical protein [Roseateles sp. P5_D6]